MIEKCTFEDWTKLCDLIRERRKPLVNAGIINIDASYDPSNEYEWRLTTTSPHFTLWHLYRTFHCAYDDDRNYIGRYWDGMYCFDPCEGNSDGTLNFNKPITGPLEVIAEYFIKRSELEDD